MVDECLEDQNLNLSWKETGDFQKRGKAELWENPANEAVLDAGLTPNNSGGESSSRRKDRRKYSRKGDRCAFKDNECHDKGHQAASPLGVPSVPKKTASHAKIYAVNKDLE